MVSPELKVIDLAKELGVLGRDLLKILEGMGHEDIRRLMSPLPTSIANELRAHFMRIRLRADLVDIVNLGYRQAARRAHPDAGGSGHRMHSLNEAKTILMRYAENHRIPDG